MATVVLINGPNLNRLGTREPEIYGTATLPEVEELTRRHAAEMGFELETFQSNHEGALIDRVHAAADAGAAGIIINPGALAHYSYALADALRAVNVPAVEVHLSDIAVREEWRRNSVTAEACVGSFAGLGADGYLEALKLLAMSAAPASSVK